MRVFVLLLLMAAGSAPAASEELALDAEHRVMPEAQAWRELAAAFAAKPATVAEFEERRFFPFKREPVVLRGDVRVAAEHGLSLHYTSPEERIVILDDRGVLIRDARGEKAPPPDARANAANAALLHILRFDFAALSASFDIFGGQREESWQLVLVPKAESLRRAVGQIHVAGEAATVRRIELRRSAKQHIDIAIGGARAARFSDEELKRFFR